jgi:hypothetical protein
MKTEALILVLTRFFARKRSHHADLKLWRQIDRNDFDPAQIKSNEMQCRTSLLAREPALSFTKSLATRGG